MADMQNVVLDGEEVTCKLCGFKTTIKTQLDDAWYDAYHYIWEHFEREHQDFILLWAIKDSGDIMLDCTIREMKSFTELDRKVEQAATKEERSEIIYEHRLPDDI